MELGHKSLDGRRIRIDPILLMCFPVELTTVTSIPLYI